MVVAIVAEGLPMTVVDVELDCVRASIQHPTPLILLVMPRSASDPEARRHSQVGMSFSGESSRGGLRSRCRAVAVSPPGGRQAAAVPDEVPRRHADPLRFWSYRCVAMTAS